MTLFAKLLQEREFKDTDDRQGNMKPETIKQASMLILRKYLTGFFNGLII